MALQPALQLVTRILHTDHPFWVALLDARSRRRIDASLLAHGMTSAIQTNWISFTAHFDPGGPLATHGSAQPASQHSITVASFGYDLPRAVAEFLCERLQIGIFSATHSWDRGTVLNDIDWGMTSPLNERDPQSAAVLIQIGAEMMWPLLAPEFTLKEKASVSTMIAATMLHELAVSTAVVSLNERPVHKLTLLQHAANMAMESLFFLSEARYHAHGTPLYGLPDQLLDALRKLGEDLTTKNEPFFEDEPAQELGFSFENAVSPVTHSSQRDVQQVD